MHTFIKSILLPGTIIASFNQFDAFSRTKGKAGVFNLLKHAKVDGKLVLAIKALVVFFFFFLRMPLEYLQRQVQSHLVISGFCLQTTVTHYISGHRARSALVLAGISCKMYHNALLMLSKSSMGFPLMNGFV